ncbi:GTP 3',8-cyclase [Bacteroidia bacterium]|nr:GTP 3',8-cyclase [Bacteroidia bacterium]
MEKIPQLRVCVTDICDKKCFYCRPMGEGNSINKESSLTLDEYIYLIDQIVKAGVSVIRFTGGEPMLYKDIYKMIQTIRQLTGVNSISLVTRSLHLKEQAKLLKEAGLYSITISLDSLRRNRLKDITKVDLLDKLKDGIAECDKLGIPVKVNTVLMKGINDDEIEDFIHYLERFKNVSWKILDYMILPNQFIDDNKYYLNLQTILPLFQSSDTEELLFDTQAGGLGIPMRTFKTKNGMIISVKDSTVGNHYGDICKSCNNYPCQDGIMALRLTVDGKLQRCLYREDTLIDLKPFMYSNENVLQALIEKALTTYINSKFVSNVWSNKINIK